MRCRQRGLTGNIQPRRRQLAELIVRYIFWPSLRYARSCATGMRSIIATSEAIFKYIFALFIVGVIFCQPAVYAKSNIKIEGYILDRLSGLPVIAATAILDNTNYKTISDDLGHFSLENIPPGIYRLIISSVGYKTRTMENIEVVLDAAARVDVELEPIVYSLPPIKVRDERLKVSDIGATIIDRHTITESRARSLPDLLSGIEGLQVESSGARQEVKIRGGAADDVLILLDGRRINGPSDGKADLSSIPLDIVERIEIIKSGAAAIYGPDALSGAINIITQSSGLVKTSGASMARDWGSWKTNGYRAGIENGFLKRRLFTRLFWAGSQSNGAFSYVYTVQPENKVYRGTRENNAYDKYNYFLTAKYLVGKNGSIGYSGHVYRDRHGLPGTASQPSPTAYAIDRRLMNTINLDFAGNKGSGGRLTAGYTRLEQSFVEPNASLPPALRFDNHYVNDIYDVNVYRKATLPGQVEMQIGGQWRHETLDHEDYYAPRFSMNRSTRNNYGLYLSASRISELSVHGIFDFISAGGTLRHDITRTIKDSTSVRDTVTNNGADFLSPRVTLALCKNTGFAYTLSTSWGRSMKIPPINALFWQGDALSGGNPGLKPEKSEQFEIGIKAEYDYKMLHLSAGLTWFDTKIEDIIVWMPLYGGWRPVNRNTARITGHDDFITIGLFDNRFEFSYKNTAASPLNKTPGHNSYDSDLPFSPRYTTTYSVKFDLNHIYGAYTIRQSGRAYTNEAATKYYDAYDIHNARLGGKYKIKRDWVLSLDLSFDNVHDENYVLIAHYPMPGYSWCISCGIKYQPK